MAHKKNKSKQAGIHHPDTPAKETTKASSGIAPQPLMSTKHDSSNGADEATARKRRKTNSNTGLDHHDPPSSDIPETTMMGNIERTELAPGAPAQDLPPEVRHLSSKYDFTTMSILSSTKVGEKVENLLLRVENFSFADPKSKPGIVVLHAKSKVASKMVSIVEIARQNIERDKGKWWQYSKLDGQMFELKTKPVKRRDDGKTLIEWQKERLGGEPKGFEEVGDGTGRASEEFQHDHEAVHEDKEMEDGFESMVSPKETGRGAKQSGNGNGRKIRVTTIMTIYFARVPVPGLKELYGYVLDYSVDANY